jgi:bacterioferritin-associated ferredoxin
MILCVCAAVSDRAIRDVMDAGASTVGSVARITGAGTGCGACVCDIKRMLRERPGRACQDPQGTEVLALAAK